MRISTLLIALGIGSLAAACSYRAEGPHHPTLEGLTEGMGANVQSAFAIDSGYDQPHAPSPNYRGEEMSESDEDDGNFASEKHVDLW